MEQRRLGRSGLKVSRLALGTMTWGRDTDEHEAGDQLKAFLEAGGTLLDTAAGYGDGESERVIGGLLGSAVDREEVVLATKAGISRRTGERVVDTSRRALLDSLDGSLQRLGTDHVDLWQVHTWSDDDRARGDAVGGRRRGGHRPGALRRHLELLRLADRPGRDAGSRRRRAARRWCRRRWSTRCCSAASSARCCRRRRRSGSGVLAVVAARPRGADRQVPRRHRRPTRAPPRRTSRAFVERFLDDRARRHRRRVSHRGRRARTRTRWRSRWPGCATRRASRRRSWGRVRRPSCAAR